MSLIGTSSVNDLPNITGSSDGNFDNLTATNISVSNKISFEEADATDEGNMTTYIYQDPTTNDIVVNNNNPLGSFRLQYGNTPDTNVLSFEIDSFNQKLNFPVGVNPEYNISFEELYALKGVNINQSIQQQINSINQISQGTGYWGTFFSSIDQYSASANTPTVATLNGYDTNNNGIILFNLVSGNYQSIKVLNGAVYNIQICFQTSSTSSSSGLFRAWFQINGVDIPNSAAGSSHHTNDGYFITTFNLILPLLPNDVLTLMWASSTGGTHLEALPAQTTPFACPTSPSVYVSFQQITYYQKAELQNIYGVLSSNTNMTDASPNYVGVKYQSGFTTIRLPDATTTPLGKEYTFFMINALPADTKIDVLTYSNAQTIYYFGYTGDTGTSLTDLTQSFVFTCISNSTNPYWSLNQVEYNPALYFNLAGQNTVPYSTTFTQQGTTNPAIKVNTGAYISLLGNLLVNGATITPTELSYLDGTTSSIQGQLNTLQQKTTAMTYNPTGLMTTIAHNLTVGSLYSENYIFVQGTNINDLYIPAGLCYSKSESDAKYATQAELGTVSAATGLNTAAIALYITGGPVPNLIPVFFGPAVGLNNAFPAFVLAYTATATTVGTQGTAISALQTKTQYQTGLVNETDFSGKLTTSYAGKSISIDPLDDKIYSATNLTLGSGNTARVIGNDVDITANTGTIDLDAPGGVSVNNGLRVDTITPKTASTISLNSGTTGGTVNIGNTLDLVYINGLPFSLWFFAQW